LVVGVFNSNYRDVESSQLIKKQKIIKLSKLNKYIKELDYFLKMNLENHINQIIKEYNYETRSTNHPAECMCYKQKIPCHDMDNLNCFLCYCPNYDTDNQEGGCLIDNPNGKWTYSKKLPSKKIWDCSNCEYPHLENNVKTHLNKIFNIKHKK